MKVYVELSLEADIIEVPDVVALNIKKLRNDFLDWMYDKNNRHQYWTKFKNGNGGWSEGVCYDTKAFVDWLNEYVIGEESSPAVIIERGLDVDACPREMLEIFF